MSPQPATGTHPSRPRALPASERAAVRWAPRRRRRTFADRVENCQLIGLGLGLGLVFGGELAAGLIIGTASWVLPAVAGAWIATRPRRPHAHSFQINAQLNRRDHA